MKTDKFEYLSEAEAADLIGVGASTLARWRRNDEAPPHYAYPAGSIRYRRCEVKAWQKRHRNEGPAADAGKGAA